ncbi:solute carrier family 13 member 3 [Elysia marginata]|uniref:Solute carrier family 13 member 3 n=1 Tax=Elysia marginata TaxID=1093978 RepID=A0AAV4GDK6_9GAST|nr:solute carrier family 13 member 3 [Elysia marginata]
MNKKNKKNKNRKNKKNKYKMNKKNKNKKNKNKKKERKRGIRNGRDWAFHPSGGKGPPYMKTRDLQLKWTINDMVCSDAGIYECAVYYNKGYNTLTFVGQQNLSARVPAKVVMKTTPKDQKNEFKKDADVNISCRVLGPQNVRIVWLSRAAGSKDFKPESNNVTGKPEYLQLDTCGFPVYKLTSYVTIKMTEDYHGRVYVCSAKNDGDPDQSASLTLYLKTQDTFGDGRDVHVIMGFVLGFLGAILIFFGIKIYMEKTHTDLGEASKH